MSNDPNLTDEEKRKLQIFISKNPKKRLIKFILFTQLSWFGKRQAKRRCELIFYYAKIDRENCLFCNYSSS